MSDPYPAIREFGPGSCTCHGTMTGCAVASTADVLVRFGKSIPRLSDGTPNMRSLGSAMGAKHRAVAKPGTPGSRHGLSLLGYCTGGTNWCAYCAFLQLRSQGVPVAYGSLIWPQIVAHLKVRHAIVLPGLYSRIPLVGKSTYSATIPARGRSDSTFGDGHMMVAWEWAEVDANDQPTRFIVSDPDFGSAARPVVPPHSLISASALKSYWSAFGWYVCYTTTAPPMQTLVPLWGPDVPATIRVLDPGGRLVAAAFTKVSHQTPGGAFHYGSVINLPDIAAAYKRLHWVYNAANPAALQVLLGWAAKH